MLEVEVVVDVEVGKGVSVTGISNLQLPRLPERNTKTIQPGPWEPHSNSTRYLWNHKQGHTTVTSSPGVNWVTVKPGKAYVAYTVAKFPKVKT